MRKCGLCSSARPLPAADRRREAGAVRSRQAYRRPDYLCRELNAPSLARAIERLAKRARADNWSHEGVPREPAGRRLEPTDPLNNFSPAFPSKLRISRPISISRTAASALSRARSLEAILLLGQPIGLLTSVIVARSLGPGGRGTVATLTVWGQLLGWVAAFSLDKALVVLARDKNDPVDPDAAFRASVAVMSAFLLPTLLLSIPLGSRLFADKRLVLILMGLVVATGFSELASGWLLATGRKPRYVMWRLTHALVYLVSVSVVAIAHLGISLRVLGMALGVLASVVVGIAVPLQGLKPGHSPRSRVPRRRFLRFAGATQAATALQYLNSRLDMLVLTLLVDPSKVGYYAVGLAAGQVTFVIGVAGTVRGITGEDSALDRRGVALAIVLAVAVIVLAPVIIPLVFGSDFRPAVGVAQTLAVAGVFNYALVSLSGVILGQGRPWTVALVHGAGVVGFAVGIAISPTLLGIARSSALSYALSAILAAVALRRTPMRTAS